MTAGCCDLCERPDELRGWRPKDYEGGDVFYICGRCYHDLKTEGNMHPKEMEDEHDSRHNS